MNIQEQVNELRENSLFNYPHLSHYSEQMKAAANTMEKMYATLRYIANEPLADEFLGGDEKYRGSISGDELRSYASQTLADLRGA